MSALLTQISYLAPRLSSRYSKTFLDITGSSIYTIKAVGAHHSDCVWVRAADLQGPDRTPKLFDKVAPPSQCRLTLVVKVSAAGGAD